MMWIKAHLMKTEQIGADELDNPIEQLVEYTAAPVTSDTSYQVFDSEQIYPMTSQDRVLRLIAFILNIISCVGWAWLIIPLAWMIPMTVISWGIYKGTRANTVAFGVCTLIFVDLISGILLLISHKDTPQA